MGATVSQADRGGGISRTSGVNRFMNSNAYSPEVEHVVVQKDKRKKLSRLATIKKKLSRSKRHSKSLDYSKAMRELLSGWNSVRDVHTLVTDYEATLALKNVTNQANLARSHASTYRQDLGTLYDGKYLTDVDLIYKNTIFSVHRAILALRCPFFRDLLARYPHYGAHVPVTIRTPGVSVSVFSALLRYLYTGQFHSKDNLDNNLNLLIQLADEFGTPNPLENDLKTLLESSVYCDAILVFTSPHDCDITNHESTLSEHVYETRTVHRHEIKCHKAILAARSQFFRNLLLRRERSAELSLNTPTCIELDESVLPRRYARVLLNALYLDYVDLTCIVRTSVSMCSLIEVQAMVSGKAHVTEVDEAMEIYQIAQFLEFPVLAQGCENILCDKLSVDNIVSVLNWSYESHGSAWLQRQAITYLQDEFNTVSNSPVLYDLSKDYLISAIKSDFLQASELEILTAVLKWGEHQLIKRIEEREPNLLTHTAHSISRKGIRKRDLNDVELRDILSDLLPHVRTDHVLPRTHETLCGAIRRGLISQPPTHMLGGDDGQVNNSAAWVRGRFSGIYMKPRLFMPYYEEAKLILDENISRLDEADNVRLRTMHITGIPDALYMLHEHGSPRAGMLLSGATCSPVPAHRMHDGSLATSSVDIIAGTIPVPDQKTVEAMIRREAELLCSKPAQRALHLPAVNKRAVAYQIQLRVVREFALPDSSAEILHNSQHYHQPQQHRATSSPYLAPMASEHCSRSRSRQGDDAWVTDRHARASSCTPLLRSYTHSQYTGASLPADVALVSAVTPLSQAMPDIAMPTSSMRRMRLHDRSSPRISRPMTSFSLQPAASSFYPRDDDVEHRHSYSMPHGAVASASRARPGMGAAGAGTEPGLDLDLGDGASHSGSRASTFERRRTHNSNSLYI